MLAKLFTPRWLISHALVLLVFFILINFGFWQLDRLDQKRTRNANIEAALLASPTQITGETVNPDEYHFRPVEVTGTYDNDQVMIIRNKTVDGASGVHLLTPLRINGSDQAILIDRGWIPRNNRDPSPEERATYNVSGEVTIEGIAYRTQPRPTFVEFLAPNTQEGQSPAKAWSRIDIENIQKRVSYPLLPIFITQQAAESDTADELPLQQGGIILDEGPHLGYAIQWFSFGTVLLIIYTVFIRQELKKEQ